MNVLKSDEYIQDRYAFRAYMHRLGQDNSIIRHRLRRRLSDAMYSELTPRQLEMVQMYYMDDIKMQDIADHLGINVSTVCRTLARARQKLNRCLKYGAKELLDGTDNQ